jgi:hypothetical protein
MVDIKLPHIVGIFLFIISAVLIGGYAISLLNISSYTGGSSTINVCDDSKCKNNGSCGQYGDCDCPKDWEGPTCEKKVPMCSPDDCSNNGYPQREYSPKDSIVKVCQCKCNPGFSGKDCSMSDCQNCMDLSKSKCVSDKTCIKNVKKWLCIKGRYLFKGDGTPQTMDCLKCPNGSKLSDNIHTGENTISDCKCTKAGIATNDYMGLKEQKCVPCNKRGGWSINSGSTGRTIVTPKDSEGKEIKDWVVINTAKNNPSGDLSDCKCNQSKDFYDSEIKENNCIRCFPGAKLKRYGDVELCECDSPDYEMIYESDGVTPTCKQRVECVNSFLQPGIKRDDGTAPIDFCANKNYFGDDFKDFTNHRTKYNEFAHPVTGQVKCTLLETPEMIAEREATEQIQIGRVGETSKQYLELSEKNNIVNTMIDTSERHIKNKEYTKAKELLTQANIIAQGYNTLKASEKHTWVPYTFRSTGRTESIVPQKGWTEVRAKEIKGDLTTGKIIFTNNNIEIGKLIPGASLQLSTACGPNRENKVIKIDTVQKTQSNIDETSVTPVIGDDVNMATATADGTDCKFKRVLNPQFETAPTDALGPQVVVINNLLTDVDSKILLDIESTKNTRQLELDKKNEALMILDRQSGCIDTVAGSAVDKRSGDSKCTTVIETGACDSEFGIINCRKTCSHNITTCDTSTEGFVNSWETF